MVTTLDQVCAAILPGETLPVLGPLRACPGIRVAVEGSLALVRWEPGPDDLLQILLAQPGVELFEPRAGLWHRVGSSLPAFQASQTLDSASFLPLARVLVPSPIQPEPHRPLHTSPVPLHLVPDPLPRPSSALRTTLDTLALWANLAPSSHFLGLSAASIGPEILILGDHLPPIPGFDRFWGRLVLSPLGFRPDPALPEPALRSALEIDPADLLLLESDSAEPIPLLAFEPLTRSSVRLALEALDP